MNIYEHYRLSASQQTILVWLRAANRVSTAGECVRRTRGVFGYLNDLRFIGYVDWADPLKANTNVMLTDEGLAFLEREFATAPDDFDQKAQLTIPIFGAKDLAFDKDLIFLIMPFAKEFDAVEAAIRDAVGHCVKQCKRADDLFLSQPIMHTVWEGINKASVLVADLTGMNANVFYELGIAHTLGKDVILIAQEGSDIPFDLRQHPNYTYDVSPEGLKRLSELLEGAICQVHKTRNDRNSWFA